MDLPLRSLARSPDTAPDAQASVASRARGRGDPKPARAEASEAPRGARLALALIVAVLASSCDPEVRPHAEGVQRSAGRRSPVTRAEEGFWTYWYPSGTLREQGRYSGGRRVGVWEQFHPNGKHRARGRRQWNPSTGACERVGVWTFWYPDGQREARGVFVAGRREGHWEYAHRDGTLDGDKSGEYHADVRLR